MKRKIKRFLLMSCISAFLLGLASCAGTSTSPKITPLEESLAAIESVLSSEKSGNSSKETAPMRTGIISEQVLEGETGTIHYSYYLPENYDGRQKYPLMLAMI